MDNFGNRLRQLRKTKDMTQQELGKALSVTNVAIAKWESNDRCPDKNMVVKIADFFNVSVDYLFCRNENIVHNAVTCGVNIQMEFEEYPHNLTPKEIKILMEHLQSIGFDINKLIHIAKQKNIREKEK